MKKNGTFSSFVGGCLMSVICFSGFDINAATISTQGLARISDINALASALTTRTKGTESVVSNGVSTLIQGQTRLGQQVTGIVGLRAQDSASGFSTTVQAALQNYCTAVEAFEVVFEQTFNETIVSIYPEFPAVPTFSAVSLFRLLTYGTVENTVQLSARIINSIQALIDPLVLVGEDPREADDDEINDNVNGMPVSLTSQLSRDGSLIVGIRNIAQAFMAVNRLHFELGRTLVASGSTFLPISVVLERFGRGVSIFQVNPPR